MKTNNRKYGSKELSTLEKAVICMNYFTNEWDWVSMWKVLHPFTTSSEKSQYTKGMSFKSQTATQEYIKYLDSKVEEFKKQIVKEGIKDYLLNKSQNASDLVPDFVDYSDRGEFMTELNKRLNLVKDEKSKTELMKMMSDLLRFKETSTNKDNELQRFYVPLECPNCPLYKKAHSEITQAEEEQSEAEN